jgi:hypothetical protein
MIVAIVSSNESIVSRAWSFFWIKRIVTGKYFLSLSVRLRAAVLHHEAGHIENMHTEKRIACLLFCPWKICMLCKNHEFEADRYAADKGHGKAILEFLRPDNQGGIFHPSNAERRNHLEQYEYTRTAPVKS